MTSVWTRLFRVSYQKASRLIAARVTEYIGYLEKGQIPPKVHTLAPRDDLEAWSVSALRVLVYLKYWLLLRYFLQNISLVNLNISLNIEGSKYNVSWFFHSIFLSFEKWFFQNYSPCKYFLAETALCWINFPVWLDYKLVSVIMQLELTKGGPGSYLLRMNDSAVYAEAHTLRDGGLLVQVQTWTPATQQACQLLAWFFCPESPWDYYYYYSFYFFRVQRL